MNPLKKLFGQTAVYGFGTVVPRLLNYVLLTPFFTRVFEVGEYGVVTELYAYVVFLMIILTYGLETGFFRFTQVQKNIDDVFCISFKIKNTFFLMNLTNIYIFYKSFSHLHLSIYIYFIYIIPY